MQFQRTKKITLALIAAFVFAFVLAVSGCKQEPQIFTDDNVVAQFVGGVITTDQLHAYIGNIGPKCHTPAMGCHGGAASGCDSDKSCGIHDGPMNGGQDASAGAGMACCGGEHGGEHTGCCGGSETALEKQACTEHEDCCMQHYELKAEDYQNLVKVMVLEQMLQEYIMENKIGQEEDTQNLIKYVSENVYVADTHLEMEEGMRPPESEIRKYYEENKELFGLKTLNEVRDEIEVFLKKSMHHAYMPKYLEELKRNAFIKKDLELLQPREPSESELRSYYREHRNEYTEQERIRIRQIMTATRRRAEQAQSLLTAGGRFAAVAGQYSEGPYAHSGGEVPSYVKRGDRSRVFEENVFILREGDTSILFEDNGGFYIVQVIEKHAEGIKSFEEVYDSIRESVLAEKEERLLADNAMRTLVIVNNRSYTVEEFKRWYDSLPLTARSEFDGYAGKEELIDRMVEYELLVDDARRKMFDFKNKETIQDITRSILQGTLYEKEIAGKIGIEDISDEEAGKYYRKNKESFTKPPKATISFIRIQALADWEQNAEASESEKKTARRRADEAYKMIKEGSDFTMIAHQYSVDDWSARKLDIYEEKGLPVATLNEIELHPLHEVIFALKEGEISKPFEFRDDYYIFKLWEKSGKEYVPIDEVKEAIKQVLVVQKRKERAEALQEELLEKSQLVLNERALAALAKKRAEKKAQTEETHAEHGG